METRQITFVCHICNKRQPVQIPQFTRLTQLDEILKVTKCLVGNHKLYSVKALEKEMK